MVTSGSGGEAAATCSSLQDDNDDARAQHDVCETEDDSIAREQLSTQILELAIPNTERRLAGCRVPSVVDCGSITTMN